MSFVSTLPIDPAILLNQMKDPASGGLATFFGIVRDHHQGKAVRSLYYECYGPMAERQIRIIRDEVAQRHRLRSLVIVHRVGMLGVGEMAVAVLSLSAHRAEAFDGCREAIERVKHEVPIWKKEFFEDGTHAWVSCEHAHRLS